MMTIQIAVQRIWQAINALELKRCMSDIIAIKGNFIDLALNVRTRTDRNILGKDMRGHGTQVLCKAPDMKIMNAKHTFDLDNVLHHRLDIHTTWGSFEQNVHCITQYPPGVVKDQQADQHTYKRIQPIGICEINNDARNDCTHRGYHIAD